MAVARNATALCLSATMGAAAETVRAHLDEIPAEHDLRILCGGAAFDGSPAAKTVEDLREPVAA